MLGKRWLVALLAKNEKIPPNVKISINVNKLISQVAASGKKKKRK